MSRVSPGGTIYNQQITDASADETLGQWVNVSGCTNVTFYCTSTGTTSSGVLSFEEAAPKNMDLMNQGGTPPSVFGTTTGKYSVMTTKNASDINGDQQVAVHITNASFCFVRARISTVIGGGGTVSVGLVAY